MFTTNPIESQEILKINAAVIAGLLILLAVIPEFIQKVIVGENLNVLAGQFAFLVLGWVALLLFSISSFAASLSFFHFTIGKRRKKLIEAENVERTEEDGSDFSTRDNKNKKTNYRLARIAKIMMMLGFFSIMLFAFLVPFLTTDILNSLVSSSH